MLLSRTPRPSDWTGFITDLTGWHTGDRQKRAEMLAAEWLQRYEGENVGPLDRQPIERWLEAFEAVGYFEAELTLTETDENQYEERLDVHIDRTPRTAPDLYRVSTAANARRFSWLDGPVGTIGPAMKYGLELWRCRNPFQVFGIISRRYELRPDTKLWESLGLDDTHSTQVDQDYTEWIVAPGTDVRAITIFELDADNWGLAEGRAV